MRGKGNEREFWDMLLGYAKKKGEFQANISPTVFLRG